MVPSGGFVAFTMEHFEGLRRGEKATPSLYAIRGFHV